MDVKAINQTQSALNMNTTNSEINQRTSAMQTQADIQKEDEIELFKKLNPKTQNDIIQKTVEQLNEKMKLFDNNLKIEIDKETGIQVVKIVDSETKEVIRQLPPETMLKIAKYIDEITGLLFEKKA